jgi:4-hydroxy-4-methyl-2-oxoglutarate aldolase
MTEPLARAQLDRLRALSTCTIANAIETFDVRLRNVGFTDASITSCFDDLPPVVGYAATARIRTAVPPMLGHRYVDRTDWWTSILRLPAPRLIFVEDVDRQPGVGALVGEVHANILRALGAVGFITNGAVRDLPQIRGLGLACYAHHVAVSHAYAHIFEFGTPIEIGGLRIQPGDLFHGDRHGLIQVPHDIAAALPDVAEKMALNDRALVRLCQSPTFSVNQLQALVRSFDPPEDREPDATASQEPTDA